MIGQDHKNDRPDTISTNTLDQKPEKHVDNKDKTTHRQDPPPAEKYPKPKNI